MSRIKDCQNSCINEVEPLSEESHHAMRYVSWVATRLMMLQLLLSKNDWFPVQLLVHKCRFLATALNIRTKQISPKTIKIGVSGVAIFKFRTIFSTSGEWFYRPCMIHAKSEVWQLFLSIYSCESCECNWRLCQELTWQGVAILHTFLNVMLSKLLYHHLSRNRCFSLPQDLHCSHPGKTSFEQAELR